jgi:hypothetical protein
MCDWCCDYLEQFEITIRAVGQAGSEQPPGEMLEAILVAARRGAGGAS